ncbi:MAG: DUF3422 domain-containing protein [Rhodobacter sp.]|nr:DUF3422 domain-containing protein [Rhodobacter sp.]
MSPIEDHTLRYQLANELHARPFPSLQAPCHAAYLAIKQPQEAANRDRDADWAHLTDLLDRFGAKHPQPGATHYFGDLGRYKFKWEQHTEFVSYTIFVDGVRDQPFDKAAFDVFPEDWLAAAPGVRITSALIRVETMGPPEDMTGKLGDWFVPESLAASRILDGCAVMAGDFRIDPAGHMRFAVFVEPGTGPRRVGRILQRLCEIETYKAMSMLGLTRARDLSRRLGPIDTRLEAMVEAMTGGAARADETLKALLEISAELESLLAKTSFRFSATAAYEALVAQRIEVLREERFQGRQIFREFMARRFDPSMRTVKATEARLKTMAERAIRAGDLLRTRVDVERSEQNQKLLESMDRRADLQLRLQRTVEGLSVVAISYYAVNLVTYILGPVGQEIGIDKLILTAVATPVVLLGVWALVRRIRKQME